MGGLLGRTLHAALQEIQIQRTDRIAQSAFDVNYLAWKKELEEGKRKSRRANAEEPRVVLAENDLSEDERG